VEKRDGCRGGFVGKKKKAKQNGQGEMNHDGGEVREWGESCWGKKEKGKNGDPERGGKSRVGKRETK